MKIGVLSDTHNNVDNAVIARDALLTAQVDLMLHCGDITTPKIAKLFEDTKIAFVMGNMDGDAVTIHKMVDGWPNASLGLTFTTEIGSKSVAMCHGHQKDILAGFINGGDYDYVFHGHSHLRRDESVGGTRVINPGALGGRKPQSRSFCILDLETDGLSVVEIAG